MAGATPTQRDVDQALEGDRAAVRALIDFLTPIIQARTARILLRKRPRDIEPGRLRLELDDALQEVLVALFEDGGKLLRRWDERRGLSLANFVGLVAERLVLSRLRTGKHAPWAEDLLPSDHLEDQDEPGDGLDLEARVASRELLSAVADRLQEELSPMGMQLFLELHVRQQPVDEVCARFRLSPDAIYAWRSRIARRVRRIAAELASPGPGKGEVAVAAAALSGTAGQPRTPDGGRT